jgi:hypothetical protein
MLPAVSADAPLLSAGTLVRVRQRTYLIEDVLAEPEASPVVHLACDDDDAPVFLLLERRADQVRLAGSSLPEVVRPGAPAPLSRSSDRAEQLAAAHSRTPSSAGRLRPSRLSRGPTAGLYPWREALTRVQPPPDLNPGRVHRRPSTWVGSTASPKVC